MPSPPTLLHPQADPRIQKGTGSCVKGMRSGGGKKAEKRENEIRYKKEREKFKINDCSSINHFGL